MSWSKKKHGSDERIVKINLKKEREKEKKTVHTLSIAPDYQQHKNNGEMADWVGWWGEGALVECWAGLL